MRLALISDVHANVVALRSVLDDISDQGADRIVSAGDIVGYYPYPNETIDLFRSNNILSILGNHDVAVLSIDPSTMSSMASSAVIWTAKQLNAASRKFLLSLERRDRARFDGLSILICHGSPFDDDQYIYEDEADSSLLDESKADVLVLGHTHVPYVNRFDKGIIINPGSVGQPRDGNALSSYTIFDTISKEAENHRVGYDIDKVAKRVIEEGLPEELAERLSFGI